ncbi:Transcription initiation factor TFIID subunit 7 [Aphelenchoides fujianensis]|nr:Transcription initiation factor TFIID subunit 7 [Aphelenchoides fujianensis]
MSAWLKLPKAAASRGIKFKYPGKLMSWCRYYGWNYAWSGREYGLLYHDQCFEPAPEIKEALRRLNLKEPWEFDQRKIRLTRAHNLAMNNERLPKAEKKSSDQLADEQLDWENHFLLRVPREYAERVRAFCNAAEPDEQLRISFNPDLRHGTLRIGEDLLHFTTYDLPCIVELNKTLDNVNLFKVGDLSQMLKCTVEPQPEPTIATPPRPDANGAGPSLLSATEAAAAEAQLKAKREKVYQYPHGIAPPLKNVRKKRFRKTKKKKYMDAPEVEKEVKRLLRDDLNAPLDQPADPANALDADEAEEAVQVRDSPDEDSRLTEMSATRDFADQPTSFGAMDEKDETSQAALADDLVGFLSASSDEEDD